MPTVGGEARQITTHSTGGEHFAWRPDGQAIAYGANDELPKKEGEAKFNSTFTVGA